MKNNDPLSLFVSRSKSESSKRIKKFIDNFDLERYLEKNNITHKECSSEDPQYNINTCPFCKNINYKGNTHANRLYVNQKTKLFVCYNCNEKGSLLNLLAAFEDLTLREIFVKYLDKESYEALPEVLTSLIEEEEKTLQEIPVKPIELPIEFVPVFERPQKLGKPAYDYWLARGVTREDGILDVSIAKALDVRYSGSCKYVTPSGAIHFINNRIIFPVWWKGECVGFQGRDLSNKSELKYYISEGFPKTKVIYNYERVFNAETIVICEGIFDLVKCWDFNPTCLFGKTISNKQLELLQKMPNLKNIVVGLDPDTKIADERGHVPYDNLIAALKPFWNVLEVDLGAYKDFGECSRQEANTILQNAYPYREKGLTVLI